MSYEQRERELTEIADRLRESDSEDDMEQLLLIEQELDQLAAVSLMAKLNRALAIDSVTIYDEQRRTH